jgi:hypothetical protein
MGLLRRRRAVPAPSSGGAAGPGTRREQTWQREGLDGPRASTRACGVLSVEAADRVRVGHVPPRGMERRGRACGLTGRPWDAPDERGARRTARRRQRTQPRTSACIPDPWPVIGRSLRRQQRSRCSNMLDACCPCPAPGTPWRMEDGQPPLGLGRDEGTPRLLGRRAGPRGARPSPPRWRSSRKPCVVPARGVCTSPWPCSQRSPERRHRQPKKVDQRPLTGLLCLLTTGDLIRVTPLLTHARTCCARARSCL